MPDIPANVWIAVASVIIGWVLKAIGDALSDRRAAKREREARAEQRNEQRRERHNAFQRQTLLDLQEAVAELGRTAGMMNYADRTWRGGISSAAGFGFTNPTGLGGAVDYPMYREAKS